LERGHAIPQKRKYPQTISNGFNMTEKKEKAKYVRGAELKSLLNDPGCVLDEELSTEMSSPVYSFPDGKVLFMMREKKGVLWFSRKDLPSFETGGVESSMEEYSFGPDFIDQCPALLEKAQTVYGLPQVKPDNLQFCLEQLDIVARKLAPVENLEKTVFPCLLVYAGEVIRVSGGGEWRMVICEIDQKTWEPWIQRTNGKMYPLGPAISKDLYEDGRRASIRARLSSDFYFPPPRPIK
jgi:hypothetical protein